MQSGLYLHPDFSGVWRTVSEDSQTAIAIRAFPADYLHPTLCHWRVVEVTVPLTTGLVPGEHWGTELRQKFGQLSLLVAWDTQTFQHIARFY